jgi:hypothetical protein
MKKLNKKALSDMMRYFIIAVVIIILLFGLVMCATLGGFGKLTGGG